MSEGNTSDSSRPGSVLATQASIDSNVAEARELLSSEALSVYINRVVTRATAAAASAPATAVTRSSGATGQATKRPRAHVTDADADDRLTVRPRTDADSHFAVGGTARTAHVTASGASHPSSSPAAALSVSPSAAAPPSSAAAPESTAGTARAGHTLRPLWRPLFRLFKTSLRQSETHSFRRS
ncbi:unnamed protein product [Tilletia laevis]|uniref:Uncharacterized protein n=1 Tax=Tilletia laevis TaxID=157183 RepID=A0A9N8QI46_9BASI|nr:unnamed protein product [Tilletia laevis]